VPLPVTLKELENGRGDAAKQRALYERFGFKTWLKEVEGVAPAPSDAAAPAAGPKRRTVRTVLTEEELGALIQELESTEIAGFRTQCLGTEPLQARLVGMSFAFGEEAVYLPLAHEYPAAPAQVEPQKALALLRPWLERADRRKVGQNVKFDLHVLANEGVSLAGCAHDTLIESYVLEVHERHDLGTLARRHC